MSNPIDPLATSPAVCFACSGFHDSVTQGLLCLQLALRATRRRVGDLEATLRDVDHEIATGHDMTAREAIAKALGTVDAGRPVSLAASAFLKDTVSK